MRLWGEGENDRLCVNLGLFRLGELLADFKIPFASTLEGQNKETYHIFYFFQLSELDSCLSQESTMFLIPIHTLFL